MRVHGFLLLGLIGSWAGCATEAVPPPLLDQVCLVDDPAVCIDWAYAGTASNVLLLGRNFHPVFEVDIGSDDTPVSRTGFSARVGGVEVVGLSLGAEPVRNSDVLLGTLPGTLPVGFHDAELTAPVGVTARLSPAFRIVNPFTLEGFREEPQIPVGMRVRLDASFDNQAAVPVSNVSLLISQSGAGQMELPDTPAPFVLGGGQRLDLALYLEATEVGAVAVTLDADALANNVVPLRPDDPAVVEFLILEPAELTSAVRQSTETVRVGNRFDFLVDLVSVGETPATDVRLAAVRVSGPGGVQMDPEPSPLVVTSMAKNDKLAIRWSGTATSPGSVELQGRLEAVEAFSGRELGPITTDPVFLEVVP